MRNILSNFIYGIVICLCSYLAVANVLHIIYLNHYEVFNFDNQPISNIDKNIEELDTKVKEISELGSKMFTEDELAIINDNFSTILENIRANVLLSYKGVRKIYFKDLLELDLRINLNISQNISTLNILSKYDQSLSSYVKVYQSNFVSSAYNSEALVQEVFQSYRYHTLDLFSSNIIEPTNRKIISRIYRFDNYIVQENYLADLVLKIGRDQNA